MESDATGRDVLHDLGRTFAFAEDSVPDFEVDEEPETIAVWGPAGAMLVDETPDGSGVEQLARLRARTEHELVHDRPELVAEPAADRNRKSHLLPRENRGRNQIP
jgi:hypothetical protein